MNKPAQLPVVDPKLITAGVPRKIRIIQGFSYRLLPVHWAYRPDVGSIGYRVAYLHRLVDKQMRTWLFACPKKHKVGPCYCDEYEPALQLLNQLTVDMQAGRATLEERADRRQLQAALNRQYITARGAVMFNVCLISSHDMVRGIQHDRHLPSDYQLIPQLFTANSARSFENDVLDGYMCQNSYGEVLDHINPKRNIFDPEYARVLSVVKLGRRLTWNIQSLPLGRFKESTPYDWDRLYAQEWFRNRLVNIDEDERFEPVLEDEVRERALAIPRLPPPAVAVIKKYRERMINPPPTTWLHQQEG
ncbi:MAG: hypothetical protein JRI80_00395 [Deltaproteobacteria bacterium]|nr:hypothetical protein [Deltaproteobacteria bacterium]